MERRLRSTGALSLKAYMKVSKDGHTNSNIDKKSVEQHPVVQEMERRITRSAQKKVEEVRKRTTELVCPEDSLQNQFVKRFKTTSTPRKGVNSVVSKDEKKESIEKMRIDTPTKGSIVSATSSSDFSPNAKHSHSDDSTLVAEAEQMSEKIIKASPRLVQMLSKLSNSPKRKDVEKKAGVYQEVVKEGIEGVKSDISEEATLNSSSKIKLSSKDPSRLIRTKALLEKLAKANARDHKVEKTLSAAELAEKRQENLELREQREFGRDAHLGLTTLSDTGLAQNIKTESSFSAPKTLISESLGSVKNTFAQVGQWNKADKFVPERMLVLEKVFQALEHTMMFVIGQGGKCVYHRIKKAVENAAGYEFSLERLGQIKTLYPDAYTFESVTVMYEGVMVNSFVISFNDANNSSDKLTGSLQKGISFVVYSNEIRRNNFRKHLLCYVENAYERWLQSSNFVSLGSAQLQGSAKMQEGCAASNNVTASGFGKFHSAFNPNLDVPDIYPSKIITQLTNARDFRKADSTRLEKARQVLAATQKSIASTSTSTSTSKQPSECTTTPQGMLVAKEGKGKQKDDEKAIANDPNDPMIKAMGTKEKPVSKASLLLERIRNKQKQAEKDKFIAKYGETAGNETPIATGQERLLLSDLTRSRLMTVADSLSFLFGAEGKNVLALSFVCNRLSESLRSHMLSSSELQQLLVMLTKIAPEWCSLDSVGASGALSSSITSRSVFRITRTISVKNVKDKVLSYVN
ncbi:DNA replication factor Cdt1 [Zancudomyces culisetae]|uniref:DNA replication factor Cdt1 n=1 Tax=Zancudomyces culisetae TaxID=1213189 RepID=A0A1R1PMN5_ZANCU|nr:DNA replication factor Cdt1 [Zancudomyces culisetae]|eukprot:OMH82230.1 DNA replication factor Cdt1 [Zancudomyces culisetae]